MIHAKFYKTCAKCGHPYLQQRKGTKYCPKCREAVNYNHAPRVTDTPVKRFRRANPDPTVNPTPLPIRRWKRKEPGSPIQRALTHLATQQEDAP